MNSALNPQTRGITANAICPGVTDTEMITGKGGAMAQLGDSANSLVHLWRS